MQFVDVEAKGIEEMHAGMGGNFLLEILLKKIKYSYQVLHCIA